MSEYSDEETLPQRLPWVLLCHPSAAACGTTFTVNDLSEWKATVKARKEHEDSCQIKPRFPHQVNQNVR